VKKETKREEKCRYWGRGSPLRERRRTTTLILANTWERCSSISSRNWGRREGGKRLRKHKWERGKNFFPL